MGRGRGIWECTDCTESAACITFARLASCQGPRLPLLTFSNVHPKRTEQLPKLDRMFAAGKEMYVRVTTLIND